VLVLAAHSGKRDACTGTAIARNLVLTAAHCVVPGASITVVARAQSRIGDSCVVSVALDARSWPFVVRCRAIGSSVIGAKLTIKWAHTGGRLLPSWVS
jgi:hypothetical protein